MCTCIFLIFKDFENRFLTLRYFLNAGKKVTRLPFEL